MAKAVCACFGLIHLLSSCGGAPPVAVREVNACNTAAYHGLIGAPVLRATQMQFPQPMRILRAGMMIDSTYIPERLTLNVNTSGRIADLACG